MTHEEFIQKKQLLSKEHDVSLQKLVREYAMSNNPYTVGDIIKDSIGSIEITKILIYIIVFQDQNVSMKERIF